MNRKDSKHRLKQKELVMNIFFLFERKYEQSTADSVWDIKLPIEEIKSELEEICSIHYRSNLWIYTQLRRYEEELGVQLFRKDSAGCNKGSFYLSINDKMVQFYQKQHLYVSDKIKVANGVFDKIINESKMRQATAAKIYLGAGSTIYHIANILIERASDCPLRFGLYTHNLGVLKRLLEAGVDLNNIDVFTAKGQIDPVTYTILGQVEEIDFEIPFDYVIMGTSYVIGGSLYIESEKESGIKEAILHQAKGEKMLVLTKHEFTERSTRGLIPYGKLQDFDSVIAPVHGTYGNADKTHDLIFERYRNLFEPQIMHWNYVIYKVQRTGAVLGESPAG